MKTDDLNVLEENVDVVDEAHIISPPKPEVLTDAERKIKRKRLEEWLEKKRLREEYFDELVNE